MMMMMMMQHQPHSPARTLCATSSPLAPPALSKREITTLINDCATLDALPVVTSPPKFRFDLNAYFDSISILDVDYDPTWSRWHDRLLSLPTLCNHIGVPVPKDNVAVVDFDDFDDDDVWPAGSMMEEVD